MEWQAILVPAISAVVAGLVTGLIAWGGMRRDMFWLTREVKEAKGIGERAHARIDDILKARG
jgi:hypothetical protein